MKLFRTIVYILLMLAVLLALILKENRERAAYRDARPNPPVSAPGSFPERGQPR